jgi:hypothetical protein
MAYPDRSEIVAVAEHDDREDKMSEPRLAERTRDRASVRPAEQLCAGMAALVLLFAYALHGWPGREVGEIMSVSGEVERSTLERFLIEVDRRLPRHAGVVVRFDERPSAWDEQLRYWNVPPELSPRPDVGATVARYYLGPRPIVIEGREKDARARSLLRKAPWLVIHGQHESPPPEGWELVLTDGQTSLYRRR